MRREVKQDQVRVTALPLDPSLSRQSLAISPEGANPTLPSALSLHPQPCLAPSLAIRKRNQLRFLSPHPPVSVPTPRVKSLWSKFQSAVARFWDSPSPSLRPCRPYLVLYLVPSPRVPLPLPGATTQVSLPRPLPGPGPLVVCLLLNSPASRPLQETLHLAPHLFLLSPSPTPHPTPPSLSLGGLATSQVTKTEPTKSTTVTYHVPNATHVP